MKIAYTDFSAFIVRMHIRTPDILSADFLYLEDFHQHHLIAGRVGAHEPCVCDCVGHVLDALCRPFMIGIYR